MIWNRIETLIEEYWWNFPFINIPFLPPISTEAVYRLRNLYELLLDGYKVPLQ